MDFNNWKTFLKKYTYEVETSKDILSRIESRRCSFSIKDFDIINEITLWNLNRVIHIDSDTIKFSYQTMNVVNTPEDATTNTKFLELLNKLLASKRIRLSIASTILKFYKPNVFPNFYKRRYRQVFKKATYEL